MLRSHVDAFGRQTSSVKEMEGNCTKPAAGSLVHPVNCRMSASDTGSISGRDT